ncbi:alpha/beta fold hydrolase [Marinobacter sp. NP-4(2019)]|uniref:alpha/beta fold hydrolase n=1 Tax=Marinobacter sp. NP-4(2019) TaxID=2488665 RepID=UPI00197CEF7A|nr:alpha/beta fold hydrolase [Marinobacter sp. NP-4(2019)]
MANALGWRRFPLLGICQGGAVAAAYAARHPERVSRLVLYNTYAKTACNHVSNICSKLDITTRAQLIVRAREAGFGNH